MQLRDGELLEKGCNFLKKGLKYSVKKLNVTEKTFKKKKKGCT